MAPRVVIVGAGPAGMVLALQLASNGVPVRVVEQHADFEREFRGELLGPLALPSFDLLGVLRPLTERGHARPNVERRMFVGASRQVVLPGGRELGAQISQPGLLSVLHELCGRYPNYRLDFGTTAIRLVREGGRVSGLVVRRGTEEAQLDADLVIACNGRNSRLRRESGIELELADKPDDTLWLRFDFADAPQLLPDTVDVHMYGRGVVLVHFAPVGPPRLQVAYSAPGELGELRRTPAALRERMVPLLPERLRAPVAAKLGPETEMQLLKVSIDRLKRWHAPGLLFVGDAAHTMSPAGGQGLNLAIRDAVTAANVLVGAVREGRPIDDALLASIEQMRRAEIEQSQAGQLRAHGMVQRPLPVLHLMFSALSAVQRFKRFEMAVPEVIEPKYPPPSPE